MEFMMMMSTRVGRGFMKKKRKIDKEIYGMNE
jgi:hypothetical protein